MIRTVNNWIALFVCLLISLPTANAIGQSDGLRLKLETGDKFEIVLVQNSNSETKIDSRETNVDSATTITMGWEVSEVEPNGDATIAQSLTSVKLSVTGFTRKKKGDTASPLMSISFDTSAPDGITRESKNLMKQIQPLLGLKFDVVMSPRGEIKEVTVPEAMTELLDKMPDTQSLRALFSKTGLKDILGASAIVLPEGLKEGQSWTEKSISKTALGTFNRNRTYTFVGKKTVDGAEIAEFSVAVTLEPTDVTETKTASDILNSKLIEFTGSGKLLMDVEEGFFKTSKVENRAHSEKPYREKKIDTVVSNQIEMTVTKK